MTHRISMTAVLTAMIGASFGTAAFADRGPRGQGGMMLEMFDTIDADKDGKVTEAEVEAYRAAEFAKADANSDSVLSAEELAAWQVARMSEMAQERSARMISRMDDNGDGSLSAEELSQTVDERRFGRLDRDGDGAVSKEEAEAARDRFSDGQRKMHGGGPDGAEN